MEYVEGETLAEKISRGPLEISTAIEIAIQVTEALVAAHKRGVVNCDIKSGNIMLTGDGAVKVLDFGLSRSRVEVSSNDGTTSGTVSYMSPEQARGESLDERTDLFSFGVVLYEVVTGGRLFERETRKETLDALLGHEPPPLGAFRDGVPLELESIVRKALEKSRDERYQSALDMLTDLRRFHDAGTRRHGDAETSVAEAVAASPRPRVAASRSLWLIRYRRWFLVIGLLAALIAGLDLLLLRPQGSERVRDFVLLVLAAASVAGYATLRARAVSLRYRFSLPSGAAFRGLLPFQEADQDCFYGRDVETAKLFSLVTHDEFRFGVLFGESGSGKTSLIRAGLMPRLRQAGYTPIYCRSYKDPMAALVEECRKQKGIEPGKDEPLTSYLCRVAEESGAALVIICDQFEEFFVSFRTGREREPFVSFVAACNHSTDIPVGFLLSMRSDFLYLSFSEFGGQIPEPLIVSRRYHLRNFDEEQAAEIIERSVRGANLPFESGMSRQVARDLATNDTVLPSELQIVGEQLQSKRIFTLDEYRRAGGKEQLVHGYLEDVIQASGDQEAARVLLRSLISDENTRLTLPLEEIARRTQRSEQVVERMLNLFAQARLVREIQDEEPWRYELMHEYLIERINQVTGRVMDATQRANRLLRQYLSNYALDKRTRIPVSKVWFIRRYADVERGERERELLRKSLRWGLVKTSALVLLLAAVTTFAAAALSVTEEWEMVRLSDGHTAAALQAVFSPDGRLLVSCGEDGKVIVWDFGRRERLATFTDHTGRVNSVAFSPDGKWFATGGEDRAVIVWDAARLEKAMVLSDHRGPIRAVVFSPDGRLLGATSAESAEAPDGRTILWSVGRWKIVYDIPHRIGSLNFLFAPNGRQLISSASDIWDIAIGQQVAGRVAPDAGGNWGALSPDGTRLVSVDPGGRVEFLDMTRRKVLRRHRAHRDHGRSVAFSSDGRLVASGAESIILWDAARQEKLMPLEHTSIVWNVAFSPDGRWLVSTHGDGSILVWDVAERERIANLNEHSGPVRAVAFSSDGRRIASASEDRSVIIWDATSGRKEAVLVGHNTRVMGVAFSPDGKWVASCDQDGALICWDVEKQKPRWAQPAEEGKPRYCLAISPDGRFVATSRAVYDSADGRQVVDLAIPHIYGEAFSADGQWLACAAVEVILCDTENWQVADRSDYVVNGPISVSFSPDSKQLVSGSDDGTVRLWQINPLREVAILGKHPARVKFVAFSPDGKEVASASDDRTIALWDVGKRSLITNIGTHTAPVLSVAFSPDGKRLVSGEHDKSVRLYTRHRSLWGYRLD